MRRKEGGMGAAGDGVKKEVGREEKKTRTGREGVVGTAGGPRGEERREEKRK
jgi:hypothetical protein